MAEVTSAMVKDLREKTGAGMMDCKKALVESSGDVDKAITWLREKGLATAGKKAGRSATEGAVGSYIHLGLLQAICIAMSFTSAWNFSLRAVKSVSQFTSTSTPTLPPMWMYEPTAPSVAERPDFFCAVARPFLRSQSTAFSRSPLASCSAFLQSIIPAPVFSRRSFTIVDVIS